MTDIVTVYTPGHWDSFDSYGLIAVELARNLEAIGCHVNAVGLGDVRHANQTADVQAITGRPIRPSFGGFLLGYPTGWDNHSPLAHYGPRVGITMFESSKLPPGWVEGLNRLDAVVVPSTFCREVFRDCGVGLGTGTPIHVVPLGIDEIFQPHWRERQPDAPYTFIAIGDRGRRKGIHEAIQAFVSAFGEDPAYRLIIKTRVKGYQGDILNENIDVIRQDVTAAELYRLYLEADCMVFPARGEGFGLPPREAAATGMPVICTNWSGLADDIDLWGIPLGYELATADWRGSKNLEGLDLGLWANPNVNQLAMLMQHVARNREMYQQRAHAGARDVRRLYSWRRFAETVYDIWRAAAYPAVLEEEALGNLRSAVPILG